MYFTKQNCNIYSEFTYWSTYW
uniref:Uncharacterized protein n=1 Tax=Anguilla anguilla TaxID=7936 RepID=A0A0E9PXT2_ANGAN